MRRIDIVNKFNKFREISLKNAEDLLKGAKAALDAGVDHASFHLSLLALEEIGKIEMEVIRVMSLVHPRTEPLEYRFDVDDHERKLFWAFWGPSFGREKQTRALLDKNHTLARNLHESRLLYLYSDPNNPQHWSELMKKGEAKQLYDLAETRLKMEIAKSGLNAEKIDEPDEDLQWFFKTQEDEQKRKEIWGHKSQEKLLELGDVKKWIAWLREVYAKHEKQMREYAEKELQRKQPPKGERMDQKWRIAIEIVTPSHAIRQNQLNKFNDGVDWIKLKRKDAHMLGIDFILPKNIPIQGLWEHGWGIARMFVVALNIATNGFFWWNIKRDPARYYKEIWDLENDAGVRVERRPRLEINWQEKRFILREVDLSLSSLIFSYLSYCHKENREEHLNRYVVGLSLLAKNDIHLRLEMNAFEEFFKALKKAMIENGDWGEKEPFEEAYQKATSWRFSGITNEMRRIFSLGFKVESEHKGFVDLTAVYAMKNYCEIYFQTLAVRYIEKKNGKKVRIIMGSDDSKENEDNKQSKKS